MFEHPRSGRQARNFTTNVPKILVLKTSSEQIFSRKLPLGAPDAFAHLLEESAKNIHVSVHWLWFPLIAKPRSKVLKKRAKNTSSSPIWSVIFLLVRGDYYNSSFKICFQNWLLAATEEYRACERFFLSSTYFKRLSLMGELFYFSCVCGIFFINHLDPSSKEGFFLVA